MAYFLGHPVAMTVHFVADSWPMVFDDSGAREDWGWRNAYDLDGLVRVMLQYLAPKFGKVFSGP